MDLYGVAASLSKLLLDLVEQGRLLTVLGVLGRRNTPIRSWGLAQKRRILRSS